MNINLKHWTGTVLVAVAAGFVIFGLIRGQKILSNFFKSEPSDGSFERGELLEQIQLEIETPTPLLLKTPRPTLTKTLTPVLTLTPAPTLTSSPEPTLYPTLSLSLTPFTPTLTPTPTPESEQQQAQQNQCQEGQVDINTASKEDIMKIKYFGGTGTRADELISLRPFSYVDDLERVKGIGGPGSKTLTDIKEQGIACVE